MAESVVTYALTSKARIKAILEIDDSNTAKDVLIERYISGVTDFIESQCNRRFKRQAITGEIYSINAAQDFLILRNTPVISIEAFKKRDGLPNAITWSDVSAAEYELRHDAEGTGISDSGIIECGFQLNRGANQYKVDYTAGYLIDWANPGSATHNLPFDISNLAEELVVRKYKRREKAGVSSESFDGNQTSFEKDMDPMLQAVIDRYRMQAFH